MEKDFGTLYVKDLLKTLLPYANDWHDWKEANSCFLNENEIIIIENYLFYGSHLVSCYQLNLSLFEVVLLMKEAKLKLNTKKKLFKRWRLSKVQWKIIEYLQEKKWKC